MTDALATGPAPLMCSASSSSVTPHGRLPTYTLLASGVSAGVSSVATASVAGSAGGQEDCGMGSNNHNDSAQGHGGEWTWAGDGARRKVCVCRCVCTGTGRPLRSGQATTERRQGPTTSVHPPMRLERYPAARLARDCATSQAIDPTQQPTRARPQSVAHTAVTTRVTGCVAARWQPRVRAEGGRGAHAGHRHPTRRQAHPQPTPPTQ